jgi:hypothetical protein
MTLTCIAKDTDVKSTYFKKAVDKPDALAELRDLQSKTSTITGQPTCSGQPPTTEQPECGKESENLTGNDFKFEFNVETKESEKTELPELNINKMNLQDNTASESNTASSGQNTNYYKLVPSSNTFRFNFTID